MMDGYHKSVLLNEVIKGLSVEKGKWYLDCTVGDGGHSLGILKQGGNIVGLDVDPQALERAAKRFEEEKIEKSRFKIILGNFRDLKSLIQTPHVATNFTKVSLVKKAMRGKQAELADQNFSGVVFDLGVSSLQLFDPERGFSFARTGPLDMRMDPDLGVRALDLINALSRKELYELFKTLGEEKYSWDLAGACKCASEVGGIKSTTELARIVKRVVGRRDEKIHPATSVFQALRIAVNDELGALQEGLDQVLDLTEKNGCICIISFHSLEDRIVKSTFKRFESEGKGEIMTKKPTVPSDDEVRHNYRSRSGKLRIFKKI